MPDIKDVARTPGYAAAASSASKATIFVFIATFAYMAFFSEASSGFIGGLLFLLVGTFVASLMIAMPIFLLKIKVPNLADLFSLVEIAATIYLTRFAFLWLFSQSPPAITNEAPSEFVPRSFKCEEPLPEFTLGRNSDPTASELSELCGCIYAELSDKSRDVSQIIAAGKEADLSPSQIQEFVPVFGRAIEKCGGNSL